MCVRSSPSSPQTVEHGFPNQPSALAFDPELRIMAIGTRSGAVKMYPLQLWHWGLVWATCGQFPACQGLSPGRCFVEAAVGTGILEEAGIACVSDKPGMTPVGDHGILCWETVMKELSLQWPQLSLTVSASQFPRRPCHCPSNCGWGGWARGLGCEPIEGGGWTGGTGELGAHMCECEDMCVQPRERGSARLGMVSAVWPPPGSW